MKCILVALIISASGVVCASQPTGTESRTKRQTERYKKGPTKKQIKEGQAIKAFVEAKYGAKKK